MSNLNDLNFSNLVSGKEVILSGKRFEVASPFYPEFVTKVPDSNLFDLKTCVSKAKSSAIEISKLSFGDRAEILRKTAKNIRFDSEDLEYVVKMTGMPITFVEKQLQDIKNLLLALPELIENTLGNRHGRIAGKVLDNHDLFKILYPIDGIVYSVTPANDPRIVSFISAWLVCLGIPGIIKPAKTDFLIAQKVIKKIIENGYPASGLNILGWNTSGENATKINFSLVDAAKAVWVFGDDTTVDNLLRFEDINGHRVDHFSDKIVLRHSTGRAAAVCDENIESKKIVNIITESCLEWPIGCNSLKAIFDASKQSNELTAMLNERFSRLEKETGNPFKHKTKVGFVDKQTLTNVSKRIKELESLRLLKKLQGKQISELQSTPFLLATEDKHSEFLAKEFSIYVLALKKCASFEEAVSEANESAGSNKRLAISVFSEDGEKVLKTNLHAHHIKRMRHSTELDILFHEGNDYLHRLTIPQIHREKTKS